MQANNKNMKENIKIKNGFQGERSLVMPEMILDLAESDPVLRTLHITDIGYYPHATYHYRERTEPIDQCVLIYCVKGSGHYSIDGKQYKVKANQYFIVPANTPMPMPPTMTIPGPSIGFTSVAHWHTSMPKVQRCQPLYPPI